MTLHVVVHHRRISNSVPPNYHGSSGGDWNQPTTTPGNDHLSLSFFMEVSKFVHCGVRVLFCLGSAEVGFCMIRVFRARVLQGFIAVGLKFWR